MIRTRDVGRWGSITHSSPASFIASTPDPGAHAITYRGGHLDILIQDRDSNTTLVVFHSALTEKIATLPAFSGRGLAHAHGMNLIAVADPSLEMGDVDLAWFIGNRGQGHLRPILSELIHHCLQGLGGQRTVIFGASGGGYAAVNFGNDLPDSIVVAVNPRLDLSARPRARMNEYLQACHGATSATPMLRIRRSFVTNQVADSIVGKLPYDLLLFQNLGDHLYLTSQAQPFIERLRDDPRLFVRFDNYADGHQPIPANLLAEIMRPLASNAPTALAIQEAGFTHPSKEYA